MTAAVPRPAPRSRPLRWLRRLALIAVAVVAIIGAAIYTGVLGFDHRLHEEIRARVEAKLQDKYPHLHVKVDSAQILAGRGIQIRGVSITDPASDAAHAELVFIDEILAACDTSMHELLTHEPHITGLTFLRPRMSATRLKTGEWNVAKLLPLPKFGNSQCPTRVEDATILVCDPAINAERPLVLKNLDLVIAPDTSTDAQTFLPQSQSPAPLKIAGQLACEHFKRLTVEGWFDPVGGVWAARGDVEQLVITPALEGSLPIAVPTRVLSLHDLHGKLTLQYEVTNQTLPGEPSLLPFRFLVSGKLEDARLDDPRLPHPMTDLSAQILADDRGIRLQEITARCGTAKLFLNMTRDGWQADAPLAIKGRLAELALDSSLADALSEKQRAVWDRFLPTGSVHADFDISFDGRAWTRDVTAELVNVSIAYEKFPYRVTNVGGKVRCTNRELQLDTFATAGRTGITCKGSFLDPGPEFTGWLDIASDAPLPLDERLLLAMDEKSQTIVRSLSPRGSGAFRFRLERDDPAKKPTPYLAVALKDCALRYEKFPYPLDGVSGTIVWQQGEWRFEKFSGSNDNAIVQASGYLVRDRNNEQQLHLEFVCADVPLENDLKRALPEKQQRIWTSLAPAGTLDQITAIVDLNCPRKLLSIDVQGHKHIRPQMVDTKSVTLEPACFPYRLDRVTGSFQYKNGDIVIKSFKAQHDRARLSGEAVCQLNPDGGWSVSIERFFADRVEVDRQLLAALPEKASAAIAKAKLQGPLHLAGAAKIDSDGRTAAATSAAWDVSIDLENGSVELGTPLEHIHGGLRIAGSADKNGYTGQGEIAIDSIVAKGVQLTQVIGPLSLDGQRVLLGAWAQQQQVRGKPPRQITAKVFDGSLVADAAIALDEDGAFEVQTALSNASLAKAAAEAAPQRTGISGKAEGYLKLAGMRKDRSKLNGSGVVRLRDANIYELPVMVALLKILSIREPDKTAFDTGDLDFRIAGEHIYVDRLDFVGNAITLKGSGEMDWQRHLNLQFYTMVGRDEVQLPVLRPLLGEASRNLMLITVGGTLDQPNLKREAFPGLNETLQQIFPEGKLK